MTPMSCLNVIYSFLIATVVLVNGIHAADAPDEWKKVIEAAKKEGKIVAGGPPTAVLRKQFKETFENRFGIELELLSAPGSAECPKSDVRIQSRCEILRRAARRLGYDRTTQVREHARAVHGFRNSSRSQRSQAMVGRSHVGRQCENQPLHLFVLGGFLGAAFLQHRL